MIHPLVLAAAGVGFLLSSYSILGRLGMSRGVHLLHISIIMGLGCAAWFVPLAMEEVRSVGDYPPSWLAVLGTVNGGIRYLGMVLWDRALRMGPLSLLACAVNLGFIVTVPYVWAVHGQTSSVTHWCAVALGAAAVVLAAKANAAKETGGGQTVSGIGCAYLLVLLGAWLLGGAGNVVIKEIDLRHFSADRTYLETFGNVFFMFEYGALGVFSALDCLVRRRTPGSRRFMAVAGLIAAAASLVLIHLVRLGITLHPAIFFSTSNVTTIICSAVVGTVFFEERRTLWWCLAIATSITVVVIATVGA